MTKERAKQILPLIQAFSDGKQIQVKDFQDGWRDILRPTFDGYSEYRIKPEPPKPTYRPWTSEEVPVGGVLRIKNDKNCRVVILQNEDEKIMMSGGHYQSFKNLLEFYEVSTDFGKTWQPCGVLVNE